MCKYTEEDYAAALEHYEKISEQFSSEIAIYGARLDLACSREIAWQWMAKIARDLGYEPGTRQRADSVRQGELCEDIAF